MSTADPASSDDEPMAETPPTTDDTVTLHLAPWGDRFVAWLIDVIIVGAVLSALGELFGLVTLFAPDPFTSSSFLGVNGLALWAYWTYFEGSRGQSAGKMVLNIAVTDERGEAIDYETAAVQSLGKAFLLPIDCLVGWLFMDGEYVRLFNRLSDTIVVETDADQDTPEGVEYVKPD